MDDQLAAVFEYIDHQEDAFIGELRAAVALQSVSAWKHQRQFYTQLHQMMDFTVNKLKGLNFTVQIRPFAPSYKIQMEDGGQEPLPPLILAQKGSDPCKKTLLIYGHLDVQPAKLSDGWDSDPWTLSQRDDDGNLYGRGGTDDKGPVLGWLHAVEAYKFCNIDPLPINIKIILELDEEDGSDGLEDALRQEKDGFLSDVDYVVISDNYWIGREVPCLTHGLRGMIQFELSVIGGSRGRRVAYLGR